jgi:general secretion pathway protein L
MTLNSSDSARAYSAFPTFGKFFSWWFGELRSLMRAGRKEGQATQPAIVAQWDGESINFGSRKGNRFEQIGTVPVADAGADHPAAQATRRAKRRNQEIALAIPAASGLEKIIELPKAAEAELGDLLGFEITRQTPFAPHQVYFDYAIVDRQAANGSMRIRLLVVPKDAVDEKLELLSILGLRPDTIELVHENADTPVTLRLEREEKKQTSAKWRGRLTIALSLAALVCLIAAIGAPFYATQIREEELRAELQQLREQTATIQDMRLAIEEATRANSFLTVQKSEHPSMLDVLERLSRLIPDDTWLNRFDVENETLIVAGFSPQASALIGTIDASPRFSEVKFEAPVTRDPKKNSEKFIISARILRKGAAK